MERAKVQEIIATVMAAWSWEMGEATQQVWMTALAKLVDDEAAELGVIELYKSQSFRPTIAHVIEAYHAQIRARFQPAESVRGLAPAPGAGIPSLPGLAWSPEGAQWAAGIRNGLREEDIIRFEQQSHEAYLALGATSPVRAKVVAERIHGVIDRTSLNIGKDSEHGRLCAKHNRWVGHRQTNDACYSHVFGELIPEDVDPDLHIKLPPCSRCDGKNVGECGHLAELWAEEVEARTKALLKKRGEARDKRRAAVL